MREVAPSAGGVVSQNADKPFYVILYRLYRPGRAGLDGSKLKDARS